MSSWVDMEKKQKGARRHTSWRSRIVCALTKWSFSFSLGRNPGLSAVLDWNGVPQPEHTYGLSSRKPLTLAAWSAGRGGHGCGGW